MRYLLFIFTTFSILGCYETQRNCNNYKTGTFTFTYTVDGEEKTTRFKRTKNLNIDFLEKGSDTATIRWINNCEFIQKAKNPKNNQEAKAVHFKIISTSKDSYTFEYKLAVKPTNQAYRVERGTAFKID